MRYALTQISLRRLDRTVNARRYPGNNSKKFLNLTNESLDRAVWLGDQGVSEIKETLPYPIV
jgi:hypothetical protein